MENTLEYIYNKLRKERDRVDSACIELRRIEYAFIKEFPYLYTPQRTIISYAKTTLVSFRDSLNNIIKDLEDKLHATESNNEAYVKECLNNIVNSINNNSDMNIKVYSMEELLKDLLNNETNVKEFKCHDDSVEKSNNSINITIESELKEYLDNEFKSIKSNIKDISNRLTAIEKDRVSDVKNKELKPKNVSSSTKFKKVTENKKEVK